MKGILITLLLVTANVCSRAQEILPTELFQIYKYWQMDEPHFDKNTYDYLQTVDKQWKLRIPPRKTDHSVEVLLGYDKDGAWYKDEEHSLMLSYDIKEKSRKGVMYVFADFDSWKRYNRQMQLMDAESLQTTHLSGGTQYVFQVNDILIYLVEYPPGVNGDDRVYEVILTHK